MSQRQEIQVPGLHHTNPIPVATRLGNLLVSGSIPGRDPATNEWGPDSDTQCALVFLNIRRVMEAAGGTTDDILKLTFWLKDAGDRSALNREWLAMFPEEGSRPARHTFSNPAMPEGQFILCEIMAVLGTPGGPGFEADRKNS